MKKKKELIKKEEEKAVTKPITPEEAKKYLLRLARANGTIDPQIEEFGEKDLPRLMNDKESKKAQADPKFMEKMTQLLTSLEIETHFGLIGTMDEDYRGMAKELSSQLIKEFHCDTHAEKILSEIVVNDFIRILDNSRRFNNCINANNEITQNLTAFLSMLSKQMDRAHQQFISSLFALKQMKSPNVEMNIKTKNAFISQNQQFNNSAEAQNHEINDPK